ncbi:MAG: hypothetical protein EA001_15525 [Oscillatoriales cyanobacterium]|nr:MAG: hypothetical protein EA001_15525 [Oscillatoriales cyanobacterium]
MDEPMEKRAAHQKDESPLSLTGESTTELVGDSGTGLTVSGLKAQCRINRRVMVLGAGACGR